MMKYELGLGKDDSLLLYTLDNDIKMLKGLQAYEMLKKIISKPIINVCDNNRNLILKYKDYDLVIYNAEELIKKTGLNVIIKNIERHIVKEKFTKTKKYKITRENKYSGMKIVAMGLACTMLITSFMFMTNVKGAQDIKFDYYDYKYVNTIDEDLEKNEETVDDESESVTFENLDFEDIKESSTTENTEEKETIDYNSISNEEKVTINYSDRSNEEKIEKTKIYYSELINKYAYEYGLDSSLVMAIATQERGVHSTDIDPTGAIGLMQIQYNVWANEIISAYNFATGQMETLNVDSERLSDVDYNIKIGCMILQNNMLNMRYNTLAAIQCYNMGYGNMQNILTVYSNYCGRSVDEILNDEFDIGWLEYRNIVQGGDKEYIEHVLSWLGDDVNLEIIKNDGTVVNVSITNQISKKVY